MCDHQHYSEMDERVDALEKEMVEIKAVQKQMRSELQQGFDDLKRQMEHIYQERAEWSKWMREKLPLVGKWLARWVLILIGIAIGVNNLQNIVALFGVGK